MSADAASLRCPHCGANAAPDARRCHYCRGRLATISCPSCYSLMFDGAAFCARCGARRARTAPDTSAGKCPACRIQMDRIGVGATTLLECAECDGVWMDAAEFERVCAEAEAQAAVLHHLDGRRPVRTAPIRYRPCVRCGNMMNRVNFSKISGTVVDVCRGHGTFLDAGELHAIVTFVRDGGLERARKQRLDELKEQERQLQWRETIAARRESNSRWNTVDKGPSLSRGIVDLLDLLRG